MSPEPEQHLEERLNSEVKEGEIRTNLVNPYDQIEFLSNSLQNEWTLCIFFFHVELTSMETYKMLKHFQDISGTQTQLKISMLFVTDE